MAVIYWIIIPLEKYSTGTISDKCNITSECKIKPIREIEHHAQDKTLLILIAVAKVANSCFSTLVIHVPSYVVLSCSNITIYFVINSHILFIPFTLLYQTR